MYCQSILAALLLSTISFEYASAKSKKFVAERNLPETKLTVYFELVAYVADKDKHMTTPNVENWVVARHCKGGKNGTAILVNPKKNKGAAFYQSSARSPMGTSAGVVMNTGSLSTAPPTIQLTLEHPDKEAPHAVQLNIDKPRDDFAIRGFVGSNPIAIGSAGMGRKFYSCNSQLDNSTESAMVLYYQFQNDVPKDCVPVTLVPQCVLATGPSQPSFHLTRCLEDVAGIDWSNYSKPDDPI